MLPIILFNIAACLLIVGGAAWSLGSLAGYYTHPWLCAALGLLPIILGALILGDMP